MLQPFFLQIIFFLEETFILREKAVLEQPRKEGKKRGVI